MREIKFRVWNKNRNMFIISGMTPKEIQDDATQSMELPIMTSEDCVWQQYTGLKDENNVDIYEGDVVRVHFFNTDGDLHNIYSEVVHIENGFYEQWDGFDVAKVKTHRGPRKLRNSCKVVGNIFEGVE